MSDISPTPMANVGANFIARTDGTNLSIPVSGTITLIFNSHHNAPSSFYQTIDVVFDGKFVLPVLNGGDLTSLVAAELANVFLSVVCAGVDFGGADSQYQITLQIDTTKMANGGHFLYLTTSDQIDGVPLAQLHTAFTASNASPITYSGTTALVNPASIGTYPHFASDGSFLQAYDPARSVMPLVVYDIFNLGVTPTDLAAIGLTTISKGFFHNPNDSGGNGWRDTTLDAWKIVQAVYYAGLIAGFENYLIHHTGDDTIGNFTERGFFADPAQGGCPWAYDALTYAVSLFPSNVIAVDMVDECSLRFPDGPSPVSLPAGYSSPPSAQANGHNWTCYLDMIVRLNAAVRAGCPHVKITWPIEAQSTPAGQATVQALWTPVSDYTTIYHTILTYNYPYKNQNSLDAAAISAGPADDAVFGAMDRQAPWLALSDLAFQNVLAVTPQYVAGLLLYQILIKGAAGARIFAWDTTQTNWTALRAALTAVCPWLNAHIADVFQGMQDSPNMGPWIATSVRDGAASKMLTVLNRADVDTVVPIDTSPVFGAGAILQKFTLSASGAVQSTAVSGANSLSIAANTAIVFVFLTSVTLSWSGTVKNVSWSGAATHLVSW